MDEAVLAAALAGLRRTPKSLPPKLFYDARGCVLFEEITKLPEYYLTRTELALLDAIAPALGRSLPAGATLVEYGASSLTKARPVLAAMIDPVAYVPIDIAADAVMAVEREACGSFPGLRVFPVVADFMEPTRLPDEVDGPLVGYFPGSTMGNLGPEEAVRFLAGARSALGRGARFVVGIDRRKDVGVLLAAYDDAAGVTAAFNLNILARLNRDCGADFDLGGFRHEARWNDAEGRIEMHLVSRQPQTARIGGETVRFAAGESIHTENSHKPSDEAFLEVARLAGWRSAQLWRDPDALFAVHLLAEDTDGASGRGGASG